MTALMSSQHFIQLLAARTSTPCIKAVSEIAKRNNSGSLVEGTAL
jgi:hypothetical protein